MNCYECSTTNHRQEAIGICHHCSVGVCPGHSTVVTDPVTMTVLVARPVVLPVKARLLLCNVCLAALEQDRKEP